MEWDFSDGGGIRQGRPRQSVDKGGESDGLLPGRDSGAGGGDSGGEEPQRAVIFFVQRACKPIAEGVQGGRDDWDDLRRSGPRKHDHSCPMFDSMSATHDENIALRDVRAPVCDVRVLVRDVRQPVTRCQGTHARRTSETRGHPTATIVSGAWVSWGSALAISELKWISRRNVVMRKSFYIVQDDFCTMSEGSGKRRNGAWRRNEFRGPILGSTLGPISGVFCRRPFSCGAPA